MTPVEAVLFVQHVGRLWPQQRMEDGTPDAWYAAGLKDIDPADAMAAANKLATEKVFISLAELLSEVKALRAQRIARTPLPAPDPELADEPGPYKEAMQEALRKIAGGWSMPKQLPANTEPSEAYNEARGEDPHRDLRVVAIRVQCPHCHATAGDRCVNALNQPLGTAPAHDARLVEAGLARWVDVRGQQTAELLEDAR